MDSGKLVLTDDAELFEFYATMYSALRSEIELDSAYQRDLEKYCVAGLAAYMVWLPASHIREGSSILSLGLSILIGLAWLRSHRCGKSVERMATYNAKIERLIPEQHLPGWENWLQKHRTREQRRYYVRLLRSSKLSLRIESMLYFMSKTKINMRIFWIISLLLCNVAPFFLDWFGLPPTEARSSLTNGPKSDRELYVANFVPRKHSAECILPQIEHGQHEC